MKKGKKQSVTLPSKCDRHIVLAGGVAIGSIVVVAFLTLFPFSFEEFDRIYDLPSYVGGFQVGGYTRCCLYLAIVEPLANILLFLPIGFGLTGVCRPRYTTWRATFVVVQLLCTGLSIGVEFLQVFQPWRSASLADLLMNSLGGGAGFLAFRLLGNGLLHYLTRENLANGK